MSKPFLRFEDGKVTIGSRDLMVKSANLSIAPKLQTERVYGDYDPSIAGARTEFVNFLPIASLAGSLDIEFLINAETFSSGNTNSISRLFEIAEGMSEGPINENLVGRYSFNNMYLRSFGFNVSPFNVVRAKASYDIYGSLSKSIPFRSSQTSKNFAHGLKSFGEMKASNVLSESAVQGQFEITNLDYTILVERKIHHHIRDNEHTSINTKADGALPFRVSVESIESEMSISSNEIIPSLNNRGDYQSSSSPYGIEDSSISAYLYSIEGSQIARFSCKGKIQSQSTSISEGSLSKGSITIREIIK
jgi:hypothetical protein